MACLSESASSARISRRIDLPSDSAPASGSHGASAEFAVRDDLCQEAMRLAALLLDHPLGATPSIYALSALMCLNKARLPARVGASGKLNSLFDQDRSLWNQKLIGEELELLNLSAKRSELSEYHLEAATAAVHATATSVQATQTGERLFRFYNTLMTIRPTPVVALNRAIAVGQRDGPELGLRELQGIRDSERRAKYPFHRAAFGEFELQSGRPPSACEHFSAALHSAEIPSSDNSLVSASRLVESHSRILEDTKRNLSLTSVTCR